MLDIQYTIKFMLLNLNISHVSTKGNQRQVVELRLKSHNSILAFFA